MEGPRSIPGRGSTMDSKMLQTPCATLLLVQSHVFESIASHSALDGALHDLARQFGVTTDDFLNCLEGLVRAGWVAVTTNPDGRLSIQLTY
jgi:hypothetical protein